MKKVIYSKYSNERDKKFSIRTEIIVEDGLKYVMKVPQTQEAKEHLNQLPVWKDKLEPVFSKQNIKLNQCEVREDGICFEFIEGGNLEEIFDRLLAKGSFEEIEKRVIEFSDCLKRIYSGSRFQISNEFKEVFGLVQLPDNLEAGKVTNIDMVFGNLLINAGWNVIDYEWTFDFLIPANFVVYRTLYYYLYGGTHRAPLIERDLFSKVGISKNEMQQYARMEGHFQQYMRGSHKYLRLMYNDIGKGNWFGSQLIETQKVLMTKQAIRIYIDNGNGVSEENSFVIGESLTQTESIEFQIPVTQETKLVRIDPASQKCIVRVLSLLGDGAATYAAFYQTNGEKTDKDLFLFNTTDPQIIITDIKPGTVVLKVHLSVSLLNDQIITELSQGQKAVKGIKMHGLLWLSKKVFNKCKYKYLVKRQEKRDALELERKWNLIFGTEEILNEQKKTVFPKEVKFSILVPLYNTPEIFLREMIESVQNQTYSNWELCLADGSTQEYSAVGHVCSEYIKEDSRIKYKKLEKNLGISENTNACIEMATGEYIGLFDHDDVLHPSVLFENMKVIQEHEADFIYTDEATFEDDLRNIVLYHFKPDFSIDNLRANNYICHFTVFKSSLLKKVGGFRKEYDGSQDHDLVLRLAKSADRIWHIPKVLYFWRSHAGSVASGIDTKAYAVEAGKKAVKNSVAQYGYESEVETSPVSPSIYRIHYEIKGNPKISIIIPNKNHMEDLKRCIYSIFIRSSYKNYEILVVENNSDEDSIFEFYKELEEYENVRVIYFNEAFNYSKINNFGVRQARGEYIVFLNNDTEIISPSWIDEMLMYVQRDDVGAAGAKLYYPNDTIQHAGVILGVGEDKVAGHSHAGALRSDPGYMGRLFFAQNVSVVTAACMMVKKSIFEQLNGFDTSLAVAYNDVDLCLRIRESGYLIVMTPYAECYHYESISRGKDDTPEKQKRFLEEVNLMRERWGALIDNGDPYYNPNLSLKNPWRFEPEVKE
ncbi:glycosyltransferase family 2 protein [Anaerosacchariphilus polymeriproducens]|uniref:Glycosyltransferase family 2 protein n=1 Tax=Anaerosacchariphilus polymeriproducens TaxID=1812858 RepID=A0A371ARD4_9FIRM|nr:glycosyltransferase family 2 protein [Anaerosacchariphilus polymeriproducens]RDU22139.1 glycosyltransferase family 2 protein [Anaerosacchariphilus polymeriproducens]